jgi:ABC-type amino acid transport substrate-binding protein
MGTRRSTLLGFASIAAVLALQGCAQSTNDIASLDALRRKAASGDLRVGFIPYYEITQDNGPNLPPSGFLVEVFRVFANAAKFEFSKVQWVSAAWDSFGTLVKSGGIDFSIAGTFITPARAENVAFTKPIFWLGNGAAVLASDNRFSHVVDVHEFDREGLRVAVVSGEQSAEFVRREFKHADISERDGPDLAAAPRAVLEHGADVAMTDQFILKRYLDKHHELKDALANNPFSVLPIAWCVSKENAALLRDINPILVEILAGHEFKVLQDKYSVIPFSTRHS